MGRLHIVLPERIHLEAKAEAKARGVTLKQLSIMALRHETEAGMASRQPLASEGRRR